MTDPATPPAPQSPTDVSPPPTDASATVPPSAPSERGWGKLFLALAGYVREATGRVARTAPATLAALPCALAALPLWVLATVFTG